VLVHIILAGAEIEKESAGNVNKFLLLLKQIEELRNQFLN
jgi:hypothetical protein